MVMRVTKIILIGSCSQCPYHTEEELTGKLYCNNKELIEQYKKVPKYVGNIIRAPKVPVWCPLVDLQMVQG